MTKIDPITALDGLFDNSDKTLRWHIWNAAETAYENIAGWTLDMKVARGSSSAALVTKAVSVIDSGTGWVQVDWVVADGVTIGGPATYYYQVARTNTGHSDVVAEGKFVLKPRIA